MEIKIKPYCVECGAPKESVDSPCACEKYTESDMLNTWRIYKSFENKMRNELVILKDVSENYELDELEIMESVLKHTQSDDDELSNMMFTFFHEGHSYISKGPWAWNPKRMTYLYKTILEYIDSLKQEVEDRD